MSLITTKKYTKKIREFQFSNKVKGIKNLITSKLIITLTLRVTKWTSIWIQLRSIMGAVITKTDSVTDKTVV